MHNEIQYIKTCSYFRCPAYTHILGSIQVVYIRARICIYRAVQHTYMEVMSLFRRSIARRPRGFEIGLRPKIRPLCDQMKPHQNGSDRIPGDQPGFVTSKKHQNVCIQAFDRSTCTCAIKKMHSRSCSDKLSSHQPASVQTNASTPQSMRTGFQAIKPPLCHPIEAHHNVFGNAFERSSCYHAIETWPAFLFF